MNKIKSFITWIFIVLVFTIPAALIVLYTLLFNEWFNSLDHVQHMMY